MRLKEKMTEKFVFEICMLGMDCLECQSMKGCGYKSCSVNKFCSRSWQDSSSSLPDFCIPPVPFTDVTNACRQIPSLLTSLVLLDQHRDLKSILNSYKTFNLNTVLINYSVKSSYNNITSNRAKCCNQGWVILSGRYSILTLQKHHLFCFSYNWLKPFFNVVSDMPK